jgi:ribosomal protein L37AE/L43A
MRNPAVDGREVDEHAALVERARRLTGIKERSALISDGLQALIAQSGAPNGLRGSAAVSPSRGLRGAGARSDLAGGDVVDRTRLSFTGAREVDAARSGRARIATVKRVSAPTLQEHITGWFRAWGVKPTPVTVVVNPRLRRSFGRSRPTEGLIELRPDVLTGPKKRLIETLCHEAAHLAVFSEGAGGRPHGSEWRHLMSLAGYDPVALSEWRCRVSSTKPPRPRNASGRTHAEGSRAEVFDHFCPVCHMVRTAKRPVGSWRCASCVRAGLTGTLHIEKRKATKGA